MDEEEKEPKELAKDYAVLQLYLCDCINCSARIDPSYHAFQCSYRIWYFQALRKLRDNQKKDQ